MFKRVKKCAGNKDGWTHQIRTCVGLQKSKINNKHQIKYKKKLKHIHFYTGKKHTHKLSYSSQKCFNWIK